MNQLYSKAKSSSMPLNNSQLSQLMQLIRTTSPEQAKQQVQRLIQERGITQEEWERTAAQASEICRTLGIR